MGVPEIRDGGLSEDSPESAAGLTGEPSSESPNLAWSRGAKLEQLLGIFSQAWGLPSGMVGNG